jgi:hypothetical protein
MSKKKNSPLLKKPVSHSSPKRTGIGCSIFAGVLLVGLIGAVIVVGLRLPNFFTNPPPERGTRGQTAVEPSGLTDDTSPELMIAQREQAEVRLNSYGWVDKEADVVRIPIDRAMALIAENGLPVGGAGTEETAPAQELPTNIPTLVETPTPVGVDETPDVGTPVAEAALTKTPTPETTSEAPTPEGISDSTETPLAQESPTATPTPDGANESPGEETPTSEPSPATSPTPTVDLANVSFKDYVLPIFEQNCVKCHGGEKPEGGQRLEEGLSLKTYEDIMAGSWNGSVIEPGDVADSYLIEQIVSGRMPKEGERLSPAKIEIITAWVEAGAPDN